MLHNLVDLISQDYVPWRVSYPPLLLVFTIMQPLLPKRFATVSSVTYIPSKGFADGPGGVERHTRLAAQL